VGGRESERERTRQTREERMASSGENGLRALPFATRGGICGRRRTAPSAELLHKSSSSAVLETAQHGSAEEAMIDD